MKLKRFLLRYYPPGIILEYETKGDMKSKDIDLLDLSVECVTSAHPKNLELSVCLCRPLLRDRPPCIPRPYFSLLYIAPV